MSLYEIDNFDEAARSAPRPTAKLAALTRSEKGSRHRLRRRERRASPAAPVAQGGRHHRRRRPLRRRLPLRRHRRASTSTSRGRLGSLAAAEVISHVGARPEANLAGLARKAGLLT